MISKSESCKLSIRSGSGDADTRIGTAITRGFGLLTAVFFVMGDVAGSGVLSVPGAIAKTGWSGFAILAFCGGCTTVAGLCLARSWMILEERYPQYKYGLTRKPMATIGYHAYGKPMSTALSCTMYFAKIGGSAIYLMVASSMARSLVSKYLKLDLSLCSWNPIMAAILLTPLWLNSLGDFWFISYSAVFSATATALLVIIDLAMTLADQQEKSKIETKNDKVFEIKSFEEYASAYGLLLFSFGGAGVFPNIQNEMRNRRHFSWAVVGGMSGLGLLYLPTSSLAFLTFGSSTAANVVDNLSPLNPVFISTTIEVCLLVHCFSVIFLNINPVFLDLEEALAVPHPFTIKRVFLRSFIFGLALFLAETVPSFGAIQALIGGTSFSIMLVLPPLNYLKIVYDGRSGRGEKWWLERMVPTWEKVLLGVVIISGAGGGLITTYLNLKNFAFQESVCFGVL